MSQGTRTKSKSLQCHVTVRASYTYSRKKIAIIKGTSQQFFFLLNDRKEISFIFQFTTLYSIIQSVYWNIFLRLF